MGSCQIFNQFISFQIFYQASKLKFHSKKKRSQLWQPLLLTGLSLLMTKPAWSTPTIAANASSLPPQSPPSLPATSLSQVPLLPSPSEQANLRIASKAHLTTTVDSYQAADLIAPQATSILLESQNPLLKNHTSASWSIAQTSIPALELTSEKASAVSVEDAFSKLQKQEQASNPFLKSQSSSTPTEPDNSNDRALEDCPLDPDLGCLRIPLPQAPSSPPPVLYLIPRFDFFHSNNILSAIDPVDDGLIRPSLALLAVPPLGPDTYLVASVEGAINRYFRVTEFNYDELRIRAGIFHRLSPNMTAEIGWTNQQLFISGNRIPGFPSGTRFLNDHAARLEISRRDQLTDRLALSTFYQLRVGFAQPEDRSRVLNILFLSLNYDLTKSVQLGLDYQFAAANFTVVPRTDIYHQILGRVTFNAFQNTQLSVYSGFSLGDSSVPSIDFNSYVVGVSLSLNLPLF